MCYNALGLLISVGERGDGRLKQKLLGLVLLFTLAAAACSMFVRWEDAGAQVFTAGNSEEKTLIIDAGHGGEDGGAVSLSGVPESGLNLSIALKLDQLLGLCGYAPVLLRTQDVSLGTQGGTIRERKTSDIRSRAERVEAEENAVLISIHQNTFPQTQYSGAQVFYADTPGSQEFAKLTQEILRQALNPQNNRQAKEIPDTVYLMNHITCPAILVECGFLSNPEEEQLLISDGYQTKIALSLTASWLAMDQTEGEGMMNTQEEALPPT